MFVSEICAERIFVSFPWGLNNVKSKLKKIPLFSNGRHLKLLFQKKNKKTKTFVKRKIILGTQKSTGLHNDN